MWFYLKADYTLNMRLDMEYVKIHNKLDFPMILYHHPLCTINDMEQNKKS